MPVLKRNDLPALLAGVEKGEVSPVYLIFGERFLCQAAVNDLIARLLPDSRQRDNCVKVVAGDEEDPAHTLNLLRTYGLFGGRQIVRVVDSRLFHSKVVAKDFWDKARKAYAAQDLKKAGRALARMLGLAGMVPADWKNGEAAELSSRRWQELFGFAKPQDVGWAASVAAAEPGPSSAAPSPDDAAALFLRAFEAGIPAGNTLVLAAEAVDKRKRLYKYIAEHGVVLDLAVESGGTAAARREQDALLKELVVKTLAGFDKRISPQLLALLLDRVGFHPVAAVMETEKLALYTAEAETITKADIDAVVGRTREEALFELTEAHAGADLTGALAVLARLQESGMHPLALLAGLRNHTRRLLQARALQEQGQPAYLKGMPYPAFQQEYLPRLKESREGRPALLSGHPYVVYKMFRQAERRSLAGLQEDLAELLAAEQRLKGSGLDERLVLENFLFRTIGRKQEQQGHTMKT